MHKPFRKDRRVKSGDTTTGDLIQMPYVYSIGYNSRSDSSSVQWFHEKRLSQRELTMLLEEAIADVISGMMGLSARCTPTYRDVLEDEIFIAAMEDRGFGKLEFESSICLPGNASAFGKIDEDHHQDVAEQKRTSGRIMRLLKKKHPEMNG
jgi:hypothetical protein